MNTKIVFYIIFYLLVYNTNSFSQTGKATISQTNDGSTMEVSIYLKSTGASSWSLGFASFVFSYNRNALDSAFEFAEGRWDNDSNSQYADQIIVPYGSGNSESIEIGLNTIAVSGTIVPGDSALIGTVRFNILDPTVNHNLSWNLGYCAVLDNFGNDITGGIIFSDPQNGILPVELSDFTAGIFKNEVDLLWTTTREHNNSGFSIERFRSEINNSNENNWQTLSFISGKGNSDGINNYSFKDRNLQSGKYKYRLKQVDFNGNFEYYNLISEILIGIPEKFELSQNYPNPYNPNTKINFALPADGYVSLKIFDISGREVAEPINEFRTAGYHTLNFNSSGLSSGTYFYTLKMNNDLSITRKMMLLK